MANADEQDDLYYVVVNDEEQYSIWADGLAVPAGWTVIGEAQAKRDCLAYIEQVWTDMRPRSLREHMAESGS